ncbi:P-loop containing nucleoside triphosphate hydrolase protein [Lojkania enalia]|uniref:P-loop containing nucleoside triphosphate hydrolase protein n=1 Tax=Lojkania enalia TaxID=147567 RepID=A0A9P4MY34_9PLEO|nr:P-loop containing nucleoside triphosphate hydrolase protein [Didymosphaeria enalia]
MVNYAELCLRGAGLLLFFRCRCPNFGLPAMSRQIIYDLLWALFKPNALVYTTYAGTGRPRCVKYNFGEQGQTKSSSKHWKIECRYFDFDGTDFGEASTEVKIHKFRGVRQIDNLPAFPLQYHANASEVEIDLLECGKKFIHLIGTHHCHCNRQAFIIHKGKEVGFPVDSRIIVDAAFFRKMNPSYARPKRARSTGLEPADVTEDDLLICSPTVPGFSFSKKLWAEFLEQKEVIMALTEARTNSENGFEFDDVIAGKGRGLIALLHGLPGVGKTFTAEAVAEHLRRPLYSISASEFSAKAGLLEGQLSDIFRIASHWNTILLLDEADVYLERHSSYDLIRNGLVTVFLHKLEYLDGIMFLTTNRVSEFDEAILSRIHLMLKYNELSKNTRKQI